MTKPKIETQLQPVVTLEQILAYEHDRTETHTSSALVNAVLEKMFVQPLLMPEEVAQSLGVQRLKLTHAMELLTGHSLYDIYIEMQVKRWHDYRAAHPKCKPHELATLLGYENYNAYWRFIGRYSKRFPEVKYKKSEYKMGHR